MKLRDTQLRNLKPSIKPKKLSDGSGLHLLVQPNGSKLWRLAYRFCGKQKTLALGQYPAVPLAGARSVREEAKRLLARGLDPSVERKNERRLASVAASTTFRLIADEFHAKQQREGRSSRTLEKTRW